MPQNLRTRTTRASRSRKLVEKLDATVFGLIEALDADSADLPRLLDEALQGSLWARQLARRADGQELKDWHRLILQARARLIWGTTTAPARRGHFAMGVGLEAGLALDAMADELGALIDQADEAALSGNEERSGRGTCRTRRTATCPASLRSRGKECSSRKLARSFTNVGHWRRCEHDRHREHGCRRGCIHISSRLGAGSIADQTDGARLVARHDSRRRRGDPRNRRASIHDGDVDPGADCRRDARPLPR